MWYSKVFKNLHAAMALHNLPKIQGGHIAICKAIMPSPNLKHCCNLRKQAIDVTSATKRSIQDKEEFVNSHQEAAMDLFLVSKNSEG